MQTLRDSELGQPPAQRQWPAIVLQRSVTGRFRRLKDAITALAFTVFFGLPWLPWSRASGPDQAILFDIPAQRFYLFDLVVQPSQVFWLVWLLLIAAFLLFFVTGIGGRVFCGFFCFHTIWSDVFYRIAHFVEGDRNARIRLEKSPFNGGKILRRGISRSLWLLLSFATGLTFALYWGEARQLVSAFFVGEALIPMYWTVAILTTTTFALGGYAREAVCQHMCPYSRFQSAMIDNGTRSIRYDSNRGEGKLGRHKALRGYQLQSERQAKGVGDCIDCGYCVQVCPTAIDIRDGAQLACINCGLCADACDQIMDRQGWSRGLIGFYAQPQQSRQMPRALPLKSIGYGLALLLSCAALFADIATDPDVSGVALQMREPLYRVTSDGKIVNSYELKLRNHTSVEHRLSLRLAGLADADLRASNYHDLRIPPQQEIAVPVSVVAPASPDEVAAKPHSRHFSFQLERVGEDQLELPARFFMP